MDNEGGRNIQECAEEEEENEEEEKEEETVFVNGIQ